MSLAAGSGSARRIGPTLLLYLGFFSALAWIVFPYVRDYRRVARLEPLKKRSGQIQLEDTHAINEALRAAIANNAKLGGEWRIAVEPLNGGEWRINELIPDLAFEDLQGKSGRLWEYRGQVVVLAMRDVSCPLSKKLAPRLARIAREYGKRDVQFLYFNCSLHDSTKDMRADKEKYQFQGRYISDEDAEIARVLKARSTTDVFVLDASSTLVYRGAIDDQYGIGFVRSSPRVHLLRLAIDAALGGTQPKTTATRAPGCLVDPERSDAPLPSPSTYTYHNRISRIIQSRCESCHRKGGGAPFPLGTYKSVKGRATMIRFVVSKRIMPPWFAAPGTGPWANDLRLSDAERKDLLEWIDAGAPEGDPIDAPRPIQRRTGWGIGQPDLVLTLPPQEIPAEGQVPYKFAKLRLGFERDRWVERIEIRTDLPQNAHHISAMLERPGTRDDVTSGLLTRAPIAGYTPGSDAWASIPAGTARFIPKGSVLRFTMHYVSTGSPAVDRPKIGFIFAKPGRPVWPSYFSGASNRGIDIPPGASNHRETAWFKFDCEATLIGFGPHMHYRGKSMRFFLEFPDGTKKLVLDIPRYDFNWQQSYQLRTPITVPRGTILRVIGRFDNSASNPANPNPKARVRWGLQSTDEMMTGWVSWYPHLPIHTPREKR